MHLVVQNEIILASLRNSGKVAVMASEEDDAPIWINDNGPFVVVTDPLDGSRNIDASIPTGTIFGVYKRLVELDHLPQEEKAMLNSLQSGTRLVAAGYVLYSSATIFCASFGSGTHAFTLDHSTGDFILTHPGIKIPPRGNIFVVVAMVVNILTSYLRTTSSYKIHDFFHDKIKLIYYLAWYSLKLIGILKGNRNPDAPSF